MAALHIFSMQAVASQLSPQLTTYLHGYKLARLCALQRWDLAITWQTGTMNELSQCCVSSICTGGTVTLASRSCQTILQAVW